MHKKRQISLYIVITLIILICMITPCIIGNLYFYNVLKSRTLNSIRQTLDTSANTAFSSLDSTLNSIENTYYSIMSDPVINPLLYNNVFPDDRITSNESIDKRLVTMMYYSTLWNENILTSITLTNDFDTYHYINNTKTGEYLDKGSLASLDAIRKNLPSISQQNTERIHTMLHLSPDSDDILYIRDFYGYPDISFKGLISFQLSESSLMSCFSDFDKYTDALCFAYDNEGTVIMSNSPSVKNKTMDSIYIDGVSLKQMVSDSTNYMVKTVRLKYYPLTACVMIPLKPVYKELHYQLTGYWIFILIFLFVVIIIAFIISKFVSNYINLLIQKMTSLNDDNYILTLPPSPIVELDNLGETFTKMSKQIQQLINEKYANEILLKESEIKALQAQINPHFLFNTMLSISWKARANNDMECYKMITALSSLLKANIYTPSDQFIPFHEELQNIQLYLQIQKVRFGDRLSYDIDIDSKLSNYSIIKLCLQPIVENAIVHGFENKVGDGFILITGDITEKEKILIQIIDNGVGFDAETLNHQLNMPHISSSPPPKSNGHHIGIFNTHLRLKYIYGEQYGLSISSIEGQGTTVSVKIPAIEISKQERVNHNV